MKRLRNFEKIEMEAQRLESLKRLPEYSVAEEIGRRIAECFAIDIPQEEIGFITMHCISAADLADRPDGSYPCRTDEHAPTGEKIWWISWKGKWGFP